MTVFFNTFNVWFASSKKKAIIIATFHTLKTVSLISDIHDHKLKKMALGITILTPNSPLSIARKYRIISYIRALPTYLEM